MNDVLRTEARLQELERDLRELKALRGSRGWAIVEQQIKDTIVAAALSMADNPVMSEKERDFRCGAISTARNLLNVVSGMIQLTENDILMAAADVAATNKNLNATA